MRLTCNACGNKTNFFRVYRVSLLVPVDDELDYQTSTKCRAMIGPLEVPLDDTKFHIDTDMMEELTYQCGHCMSEDID